MLCNYCGHNEANVTFKADINGKTTKTNLCESCARERGILAGFGGIGGAPHFGIGLGELIGSLAQDSQEELAKSFRTPVRPVHPKCPLCGTTFAAFRSSGFVGCENCYEYFYPAMRETVKRIHGAQNHKPS